MQTGDIFQRATSAAKQPSTDADAVALVSNRLAVQFTEEELLPARYRKRTDAPQKLRKVKEDSEVEKRFKANVAAWRALIETMLARLDHEQAWRFIDLRPQFAGGKFKSLTDNGDFCAFNDYMILRRDRWPCAVVSSLSA